MSDARTVQKVDATGSTVGIVQPSTGTSANVTMTGASVVALASNAARKGASIFNDSGVVVYIKFGTGASATSFKLSLAAQGFYPLPFPVYTGVIHAFGAAGDIRVSEEV